MYLIGFVVELIQHPKRNNSIAISQ